jgi:hypothetical protein
MSYTNGQCLLAHLPTQQHPSVVSSFNLNYMLIPFKYPWSEGRFGGINQAGIKFYNNLINGLLEKGMHSLFCYYMGKPISSVSLIKARHLICLEQGYNYW